MKRTLQIVLDRVPRDDDGISETELASACGLNLTDTKSRLHELLRAGQIQAVPERPNHWRKIPKMVMNPDPDHILALIPPKES